MTASAVASEDQLSAVKLRSRPAAALAHLYRRDCFRGLPAVAIRPDRPNVRRRPHLYLNGDLRPLPRRVRCIASGEPLAIAREGEQERKAEAMIEAAGANAIFLEDGSWKVTARCRPGLVAAHIRDLALKARKRKARGGWTRPSCCAISPTGCAGSNGFGSFMSDTLMKLGLLGTIIGFIIMLAPIAGLDASDKTTMKASMGLMSDGMAVAMYTTLAGLVGSILLKTQYYMLDGATAALFSRAVRLTETRVVPALERRYDR